MKKAQEKTLSESENSTSALSDVKSSSSSRNQVNAASFKSSPPSNHYLSDSTKRDPKKLGLTTVGSIP